MGHEDPRTLQQLVHDEHGQALAFCRGHPNIAQNTAKLVELFQSALVDCPPQWWFFRLAFKGCARFLELAMLSATRGHRLEAMFNLRLAFESSVLACYVARHPDEQPTEPAPGQPAAKAEEKLKKRANEWLRDNSAVYSQRVYIQKKLINDSCAHAGVSALTFELLDAQADPLPGGDSPAVACDPFLVWVVGNTAAAITHMLFKVLVDCPDVTVAQDTDTTLGLLFKESESLKPRRPCGADVSVPENLE